MKYTVFTYGTLMKDQRNHHYKEYLKPKEGLKLYTQKSKWISIKDRKYI